MTEIQELTFKEKLLEKMLEGISARTVRKVQKRKTKNRNIEKARKQPNVNTSTSQCKKKKSVVT